VIMRTLLRSVVAAIIVGSLIFGATRAFAVTAAEIQAAAKAAEDGNAIAQQAEKLDGLISSYRSSTGGAEFEITARALGELVTRSRQLKVTASLYERLVEVALNLRKNVTQAREAREDQAGGSEAALEKLYRSLDWNHLDYSKVASQYWTAWARLGWAEGLPEGQARTELLQRAEGGFVRGTLEVRRPWLARDSLLGAGIARRQQGKLKGARRAFQRLETILSALGESDLLNALRIELAGLALESGRMSEAQRLMGKLPPNAIDKGRAQAMRLLEAKGWLEQAQSTGKGAGRAADLIRDVIKNGGDEARSAVGLALQYKKELEGQSLGMASDLIDGEEAFSNREFAKARDSFARLIERKSDMPGLNQSVILYKYAASLSETGDRKTAMGVLKRLLRMRMSPDVAAPAARLAYALAAQTLKQKKSKANRKALLAAGERLLKIAPDAPEADAARIWLARAREDGGSISKAIALLEQNKVENVAYPASRLELVSLRSDKLGRYDPAADAGNKKMKTEGRKLLKDLDEVRKLVGEGRLDADPARAAVLAVIRAKAYGWSGEAPNTVLEAVSLAEKSQKSVPGAAADLLRLRLAMLTRAGRFGDVEKLFSKRRDKSILNDWKIWFEALDRLESQKKPRAPAKTVASVGARVATIRGFPALDQAEIIQAKALLRAGDPERAVTVARHVIDRGSPSGPAWVLYANALESAGNFEKATHAWRSMLTGLDEGTTYWLDAQLGVARSAHASGHFRLSCLAIDDAAAIAPDFGGSGRKKQFDALVPGCAKYTGANYADTLKALNGFLSRKRGGIQFDSPEYGGLKHGLDSNFTLDSQSPKCRLDFFTTTKNTMVSQEHAKTTFTEEFVCRGNIPMAKAFLNQDTVFDASTLQFRNVTLECKKTTTGIKFGERVVPRTEESSVNSFHLFMDNDDTKKKQSTAIRAFGHLKRLCLKIPVLPVASAGPSLSDASPP
jgi:hypothetical protein